MAGGIKFPGNISATDSVQTPSFILDYIKDNYGEAFDPCPYIENFDLKTHQNGLMIPWKDLNYVNPPFSSAYRWVMKAYKEWKDHNKKTIILGKAYWLSRNYLMKIMHDIRVVGVGRTVFKGYNSKSRFCVILILIGFEKGKLSLLPPSSVK